jgi:hypothetical protein
MIDRTPRAIKFRLLTIQIAPWFAFVLLTIGVIVASWYLIELLFLISEKPEDYHTAIGEFLLVFVLGIEGLIAVLHLWHARVDAQSNG